MYNHKFFKIRSYFNHCFYKIATCFEPPSVFIWIRYIYKPLSVSFTIGTYLNSLSILNYTFLIILTTVFYCVGGS